VSCNAAGRDVGSLVDDIRKAVDPLVRAPHRVEYAGQFEAAEEAGRRLVLIGIAIILGIGFLLHVAFGSVRDAFLIMLNLPLALIGGVAGVFISGGVLSIASLIGFITVFGIAARNGIMLVSHIRHLQEREGVTDFREAVYRGSVERLVPILMTALAAGLALIPLALGGGKPGNEIQTPMAIVVLFGLLSSMLLNMIVVPALYLRHGRPVGGAR
jgi:Cu/Ag efflux pump CusA